jgi:hypothetical protein
MNMPAPSTPDDERRDRFEYATTHADPRYRVPLAALYRFWHDTNARHFAGRLIQPHLDFNWVPAHALGSCVQETGYGGELQITLHRRLVIDPKRNWVLRAWPDAGMHRFLEDLALRYFVRQFVLEGRKQVDDPPRGFGRAFAEEANRLGRAMGLAEVQVRRRGPGDHDKFVCTGWPHNVRGRADYGDAITEELFDRAAGGGGEDEADEPPSPSLAVMEFVLLLLREKHAEKAEAFLRRHTERLLHGPRQRQRARRAVEDGREGHDGSALGEVAFDAKWLAWNGGTIGRMAEMIAWHDAWSDMPILADMLEAAGCTDERVLGHLRADIEHSKRCWVLQGLRALGAVEHAADPCLVSHEPDAS